MEKLLLQVFVGVVARHLSILPTTRTLRSRSSLWACSRAEVMKRIEVAVYGFYDGNDHRITGAVPSVQKQL